MLKIWLPLNLTFTIIAASERLPVFLALDANSHVSPHYGLCNSSASSSSY
jgi:hypothetical protein